MRENISFQQVLNQVRKDERDHILGILREMKHDCIEEQNFAEAATLRDAIEAIEEDVAMPLQIPCDKEGVPEAR